MALTAEERVRMAVARYLDCGCSYTTDGKRHWCPSCSDALGGHPGVKTRDRRTPYDEAIAAERGEFTRAHLMAKAEGYRRAMNDILPTLEA